MHLLSYLQSVATFYLTKTSISSVSGDPAFRGRVHDMAAYLENLLKDVGVTTKSVDLGDEIVDGKPLKLPPAIVGKIGEDPKKKTILIYGHFDVQPEGIFYDKERLYG